MNMTVAEYYGNASNCGGGGGGTANNGGCGNSSSIVGSVSGSNVNDENLTRVEVHCFLFFTPKSRFRERVGKY